MSPIIFRFPKFKPLISGDTIKIVYDIDTKNYPGLNTINLDVNPSMTSRNNIISTTSCIKISM